MIRIVQGTISPGFGGLEMVIIEFHGWLLKQGLEAHVIAVKGTPLQEHLFEAGFADSTHVVPAEKKERRKMTKKLRQEWDSKETAFLFHRQAGLKSLVWKKYQSKISMLSHTFYGVSKKDLWHRFVFSKVHQWITLTESHKQNLIETSGVRPEKVMVVPNGVDCQVFRPQVVAQQTGAPIQIGVIARLDPQKGQDIALRALRSLLDVGISAQLHFFGEDTPNEKPIRPQLEQLITELNLEKNVIFEGFHSDMENYIPQMDLIWMPSHRETFGRCIIEAMACGVPVVASRAGGVPDIIEDGQSGLLFETKNPQDLAEKTRSLVGDPQWMARMAQAGLQSVREKYNREKIWPQLLRAILPTHLQGPQLNWAQTDFLESSRAAGRTAAPAYPQAAKTPAGPLAP